MLVVETFESRIDGLWGWRAKRLGFIYDEGGELRLMAGTGVAHA